MNPPQTPTALKPVLPDVAFDAAAAARPLDWVGMSNIALPLRIAAADGSPIQVAASVDVSVNLRDADARGIHMSRMYLHLQNAFASETVTPAGLRRVLQSLVDGQGGISSAARLVLRYEQLLLRPALASHNAGWKRYPVEIDARLLDGHLHLGLRFAVEYSSTCPASAALSRQLNAQRFADDFAAAHPLSTAVVSDWLASERGLAATPHAQRSRADVRVELRPAFDEVPLVALIDAIEQALGTPVQTAVKREDEQAFARLNAENLMFCEDAARRVAAVLSRDKRIETFDAQIAHFESLHAHDAVARVTGHGARD
ncbi:GTP cyclohydrolase FolE2 [Lysobacter sp. 1R34A]|uniref:GTP cyclohydrolase FolE2 n=1 Tax=Lysobacter sp. 1R34A TaxID=3445786 RepID=UPI003EEBBF94